MKKTFYVVIAVCMGLTACNKEGRFTPKHKIATIYESYSDHSEIWNSELGYWEYSDETTQSILVKNGRGTEKPYQVFNYIMKMVPLGIPKILNMKTRELAK